MLTADCERFDTSAARQKLLCSATSRKVCISLRFTFIRAACVPLSPLDRRVTAQPGYGPIRPGLIRKWRNHAVRLLIIITTVDHHVKQAQRRVHRVHEGKISPERQISRVNDSLHVQAMKATYCLI